MSYALFTAIPFVGHLNPLLRQAAELASRGWRVAIAAHEEARRHVEGRESGVGFVSLGSYGPVAKSVEEFEAEATLDPDFARGTLRILQWLDGLWPSHFDGLRAAVRADRPDVLVADLFATAALDVADAEGLRVVVNDADLLGSLPPGLLPPADHLPLPLSGRSRHRIGWIRRPLQTVLRTLGGPVYAIVLGRPLNAHRVSRGLPPVAVRERFRDRLVLVNGAFPLEYPRALPPTVHMVGPMLPAAIPALAAEEAAWLSDGPPVVYVNLGTVAMAAKELLAALVAGLDSPDFRALWVLREPQQALLPEARPAGLRVSAWVSSPLAVLAHPNVKAFVSHCGMNSVHESLFAGTPIVGIPLFGDQLDMGLRVVDAGAGLLLDKTRLGADALRASVGRVIGEKHFAEAIPPLQAAFALAGGVARAADLIENAARFGPERR